MTNEIFLHTKFLKSRVYFKLTAHAVRLTIFQKLNNQQYVTGGSHFGSSSLVHLSEQARMCPVLTIAPCQVFQAPEIYFSLKLHVFTGQQGALIFIVNWRLAPSQPRKGRS